MVLKPVTSFWTHQEATSSPKVKHDRNKAASLYIRISSNPNLFERCVRSLLETKNDPKNEPGYSENVIQNGSRKNYISQDANLVTLFLIAWPLRTLNFLKKRDTVVNKKSCVNCYRNQSRSDSNNNEKCTYKCTPKPTDMLQHTLHKSIACLVSIWA